MTRGQVRFEYQGQIFAVQGEGFLPSADPRHVDYVLYENTLNEEATAKRESLNVVSSQQVLRALQEALRQGGMTVDLE